MSPNPADVVLLNGVIWTGVPGAPLAEAVAVTDGAVRAVGTTQRIERYRGDDTQVIDLGGRLLIPSFGDSHTHFISGGFQLASVNLREAATPAEFARTLGEYAETRPDGSWIDGGDWDHELWPGAPLPDRTWIDSVTSNHFVFVSRLDGHMGLANTRALELAGIDDRTPDPPGGEIVRDARGRATGPGSGRSWRRWSAPVLRRCHSRAGCRTRPRAPANRAGARLRTGPSRAR